VLIRRLSSAKKHGFSLLELVVACGILLLMISTLFRGKPARKDIVETAALADTLAAELRLARAKAVASGAPVAFVIPSGNGSRPHSQSFYLTEGSDPRRTSVRDFSSEFPGTCVAAGILYSTSTINSPPTAGNGDAFNLTEWIGTTGLEKDYVICFTPGGSAVSNDLPVTNGELHLLVSYGLDYSAASSPSGTGWGVPPTYFQLDRAQSAKMISISPTGQVTVTPLDPNSSVELAPTPFRDTPAFPPVPSLAHVHSPTLLSLEVFPPPIPDELPAGVEALVDIDRHLSLRVVAEDDDREKRLECRWESSNGGALSKESWHPMVWEPDGEAPGEGAWVSYLDWKPPPGTVVGDTFVLTASVRDPNGDTDTQAIGATGTILAVDNTLIAFVSDRDGSDAVYGMMPDGNDVHRISNITGGDEPVMTFAGDRLFFRRGGDLCLQVTGGGQPVTLVSTGFLFDMGSVSADATTIFYNTFFTRMGRLNGAGPLTIYNLESDAGFIGDGGWALNAQLSPDNRKLAYVAFLSFQPCIVVADFDPTGPPYLSNARAIIQSFGSYGPDGDRIMWSPVMDGGLPERRKLIFQSSATGNWEVHSIVVDYTNNSSYPAGNTPSINLSNAPGRDTRPAFSPDGSQIVFSSDRTGNWDLFRMNVDGSGLRNITNHPAREGTPFWAN
jgi:type II secretory pathway pseudopilin PulG